MMEIQQIASWLPISEELVRGPSPAARERYARARARREAEQRTALVRHAALVAGLPAGARRAVLELHRPSQNPAYVHLVCEGCDFDGYDAEPPEWPCRTYVLVRDSS